MQGHKLVEIRLGLAILLRQLTVCDSDAMLLRLGDPKAGLENRGLPSLQALIQFLKLVGIELSLI